MINISFEQVIAICVLSCLSVFAVFTCIQKSRKRKSVSLNAEKHHFEKSGEKKTPKHERYIDVCFPCISPKKEPLNDDSFVLNIDNHYEYVVEKYTVRKLPLALVGTAEDVEELKQALKERGDQYGEWEADHKKHVKGPEEPEINTPNIYETKNDKQVYSVVSCFPATSSKNLSKSVRIKESDILDVAGQTPVKSVNSFVKIPSKASLRLKDIQTTKREITTQYLNNFSSVFVDNLKDPIPKDPENLPSLSRPYTSSLKSLPLAEILSSTSSKKANTQKVKKSGKLAYGALLSEQTLQTVEPENYKSKYKGFSKSSGLKTLTHGSPVFLKKEKDASKCEQSQPKRPCSAPSETSARNLTAQTSFKNKRTSSVELLNRSSPLPKKTSNTSKKLPIFSVVSTHKGEGVGKQNPISYQEIQSLDVGCDFTDSSSFKGGVKPKMTRVLSDDSSQKHPSSTHSVQQNIMIESMRPMTRDDYEENMGVDMKPKIRTRPAITPKPFRKYEEKSISEELKTETARIPLKKDDDSPQSFIRFTHFQRFDKSRYNTRPNTQTKLTPHTEVEKSDVNVNKIHMNRTGLSEPEPKTYHPRENNQVVDTKANEYVVGYQHFSSKAEKSLKSHRKDNYITLEVPSAELGTYTLNEGSMLKVKEDNTKKQIKGMGIKDSPRNAPKALTGEQCCDISFDMLQDILTKQEKHGPHVSARVTDNPKSAFDKLSNQVTLTSAENPFGRTAQKPTQVQLALEKYAASSALEDDAETSTSVYSPESKTSSSTTTSATSSRNKASKGGTLRWKIIIKHHKDGGGK